MLTAAPHMRQEVGGGGGACRAQPSALVSKALEVGGGRGTIGIGQSAYSMQVCSVTLCSALLGKKDEVQRARD